jgi:hypothetical protein
MFGNAEVISRYTRKQAIEDGALIDVSVTAKEAGFRLPVAITATVYAEYVKVPNGVVCQDEKGRLWDLLWMCALAVGKAKGSEVIYGLHVRNDNRDGTPPLVRLKSVCGPDDDASPCITIVLPYED